MNLDDFLQRELERLRSSRMPRVFSNNVSRESTDSLRTTRSHIQTSGAIPTDEIHTWEVGNIPKVHNIKIDGEEDMDKVDPF